MASLLSSRSNPLKTQFPHSTDEVHFKDTLTPISIVHDVSLVIRVLLSPFILHPNQHILATLHDAAAAAQFDGHPVDPARDP